MRRRFYLKNAENDSGPWAVIWYDTDNETWGIDIPEGIDRFHLPVIPRVMYFEKGMNPINHEWTLRFVCERIEPPERQNIGMIMRAIGMKYYNEFDLLVAHRGLSTQDEYWIEELT